MTSTVMDKNSLAQLIEISHAVGANREYVQAAGGNTSVKSPDGRTMAIKASGTALTLMSETDGWVEMDVAAVLSDVRCWRQGRKPLLLASISPFDPGCVKT